MPTAVPTPKAVVHQRFGAKARYTVEEVREDVGGCPGLAPQTRNVYRCALDLPGLSVATPDTFLRKKDAEQAAAQIALDKVRSPHSFCGAVLQSSVLLAKPLWGSQFATR